VRHELALRWAACALAALCLALGLRWGNARGATPDFSPSNNFSAPMIAELAAPDMRGKVFNSYELGSEIIYRDWPRLKPVIDSRIDSYGDDYFLFFNRLLLDQGLLMQFLDAAQVDHMLLLRRDFDARVRFMPTIAADWHVRLGDERMLLLERNHRAAPAAAVVGAASAPGR